MAADTPVLLLVHGFPLDSRMWLHQVEGLSRTRRVMTPDLDGHGRARDRQPSDTIDGLARQLARHMDDARVQTVDLGGLSMGGYICFAFLRLFRERVRSLVLVDTKAAADTEEGRAGRDALAGRIRAEGAAAAAEVMLPKMLTPTAGEKLRGWVHHMMLEQPPDALVADLVAMRDRPDSTPDLARIAVPTLVLVGDADEIAPPAEAEAMASAIPDARLVVVPGAAHLSPVERADDVNAAIRDHLAR